MSATDPRRDRGRLSRVGAVILALAVLVVLPGYLATRPGFFDRYPDLTRRYQSWSVSTHAEVGCSGCHVRPGPLPQAVHSVRMLGEFYLSLVTRARAPGIFGAPGNDSCLVCHSDLRTVSPKGDLRIPHRAHVSILEMECVDCHGFLVHESSPEGKHTPPMAGCLECHDGDTAKDSCWACHTEKATPASHRSDGWLVAHAKRAGDADCAKCHGWTEDWCARCHSELPRSHGKDWRATHGSRVKEHRGCEACHTGAFCIRCHGEVPKLNFNPALGLVE